MDDLSGLDWNTTTVPAKAPTAGQGNYYASFRSSPSVSGTSTPYLTQGQSLSKPSAKSPLPSKPSTPANDSFANLVSFGGNQASKNISLQDKQKALQEQRSQQTWANVKDTGSAFDIPDQGPWSRNTEVRDSSLLGKSPTDYTGVNKVGGSTLSTAINKPFARLTQTSSHHKIGQATRSKTSLQAEDDLLAAFAADALVDSSSNYPKPDDTLRLDTGRNEEDDDPFGLGVPSQKTEKAHGGLNGALTDEEDVLGLLGRPVSELPVRRPETLEIPSPVEESSTSDPLDRAIAELVDMGFSVDVARNTLGSTPNGLDVQAAVSIILSQAHESSRQRTRSSTPKAQRDHSSRMRPARRDDSEQNTAMPAWMRQQGSAASAPRREDSRSPAMSDKDAAKYAADLGNNLFKTANSLWKTGTKRLNQAVSEFNSDSDTSQPKWMRDAIPRPKVDASAGVAEPPSRTSAKGGPPKHLPTQDMTDEALLLEARDARPQPRSRTQTHRVASDQAPAPIPLREHSSATSQRPTQREPQKLRSLQQNPINNDTRPKLNRQLIEEQSSQAYASPARRKKQPVPQLVSEVDLLNPSNPSMSNARPQPPQPTSRQAPGSRSSLPAPSSSPRPRSPPRRIPTISPSALRSSTNQRISGTNLFKSGDYASATASYTAALASLPSTHPLSSLVLTNRALTHLKTGDPKACIADVDTAIAIIGPSKGIGETVDLGNGEANKPMPEIWGKAMTRRAEALEQLERWNEAAIAWQNCVEAGVGGSTSTQGRSRCERAAGKGHLSAPQRQTTTSRAPSAAATSRPASSRPLLRPPSSVAKQQSVEAVSRLRALNAAAERADDERFALADSVSARLDGWRKGKETNLRALLGSLDTVLWEGSGWKKVGMSELIVAGKVKVAYMKGIAKVHPDKLPPTATTEQVMISGAVFSTLNEAWDRFKLENGL